MLKNTLLLLFISAALAANCQQPTTLSGKIVDDKSNAVPDASVYVLNSQTGTVTNKQGEFELRDLPSGKYILRVTAIGFADVNKVVDESNKGNVEIVLSKSSVHLDEVIVSAQKREEMLQQLPFSIAAFSARKVEDYRLWDTKSISGIVPNLYSSNPGEDRNVTSIRGITSSSYDPAVATYIDGVNQFNLDTYIPQLFDVERIEVLRGPQGTLYGRNAMGGVINIITKKPGNTTTGFASVSVGNFNRQRYNAGIRGPEYVKLLVKLGREYKVPVMSVKTGPSAIFGVEFSDITDKDIFADAIYTANPDNYKSGMASYYKGAIDSMKAGLNVFIIHTAFDDKEMQAVTVDHPDWGAAWRQADYNFFSSDECKNLLKAQNIRVITWKEIRDKLVRK